MTSTLMLQRSNSNHAYRCHGSRCDREMIECVELGGWEEGQEAMLFTESASMLMDGRGRCINASGSPTGPWGDCDIS